MVGALLDGLDLFRIGLAELRGEPVELRDGCGGERRNFHDGRSALSALNHSISISTR